MSGQLYNSLGEISDPHTRDALLNTLRALDQFAEMSTLTPGTISPPPAGGAPPPTISQPEAETDNQAAKAKVLAPLPMAEQIEDILQQTLAQTPSMAQRDIHIHQALDGGVRIEVDGQSFEGVGDIPDPMVRSLIQDAIHVWETRGGQ
jgi:hypothetical protein